MSDPSRSTSPCEIAEANLTGRASVPRYMMHVSENGAVEHLHDRELHITAAKNTQSRGSRPISGGSSRYLPEVPDRPTKQARDGRRGNRETGESSWPPVQR